MWAGVAAAVAAAEHVILKGGSLPFVVAGLVGVAIGAVEQASRLRSRFTLNNWAWAWWGSRLLLELVISLLALVVLREAKPEVANHVWAWVIAGGTGPAVMRLRVLDLEKRPVGVATIYEPVRDFIEERLGEQPLQDVGSRGRPRNRVAGKHGAG